MDRKSRFILLFSSKDQKGIVAGVSDFIFRRGGNIVSADQYSTDPEDGDFFLRVEFIGGAGESSRSIEEAFAPLAQRFGANWTLYEGSRKLRMGILVSRPGHCLFELLYLWQSGELPVDIPFVLSNHEAHGELVSRFKVPFFFVPSTPSDRREQEILSRVRESDFLVLARYMLTLSGGFLSSYGKDIINIHHGFLPSFKGARPYHQAYAKGVKVIGATSHFVTEALDEGPIICQKVESVSHRDDPGSLIRKGKNLEKHALSRAVSDYAEHRIIRAGGKTIVF